jgi:4-alpha-glucanotransferase
MLKDLRASGILLHITSLPSNFGIGDLGPESYKFVDLLARLKQRYWSILPLSPTRLEDGNSPYHTSSAFAGNPLLISLEKLIEDGLLPKYYTKQAIKPGSRVDFEELYAHKMSLLNQAYAIFKAFDNKKSFDIFCSENKEWLDDFAFYAALRKETGKPWHSWGSSLRKRDPQVIATKKQELKDEIKREKFVQYLFYSQWSALKSYCRQKNIRIIGDMPFYMAYDSADVWVNQELFSLNSNGKPLFVGGVPPDYFSATGQLWGNPVYNWKKMQQTGFKWWINRISYNLKLFDELRLDHFRGFIAYWQVSASAKTAKKGRWVKAPSDSLFAAIKGAFPKLPFIAEDLGMIDEPVREAIKRLRLPGMRVLLFAFDGSQNNCHLPKNHNKNSVVYTGTHDTDTVKGWFVNEATEEERLNVFNQIGKKASIEDVSFEFVKLALSSKVALSIIPLQDILSLGSEARMNNPSSALNNWEWRVTPDQLSWQALNLFGTATIQSNRNI